MITITLDIKVTANGSTIEQVTEDLKKELSKYFITKENVSKEVVNTLTRVLENSSCSLSRESDFPYKKIGEK